MSSANRLSDWTRSGPAVDYAWFAFALANLAAMAVLMASDAPEGLETVPFHFIYVSFTILYGFRAWRAGRVLAGITFVAISTGIMTLLGIHAGREAWPELTEVPLMTLMFLAMVFHVRRRQQAVATAARLADVLQSNLDRQREFVSDSSHELLTPITIARGHLDVLRQQSFRPGEVEETTGIVLAELDRMQRLIDRLLLLEAIAAADGVDLERVSVKRFCDDLMHRWEPAAARVWQADADVPGTVTLDRERMVVAVDALLENAVRHTRPGGKITLVARAAGDRLGLTVLDDGDGIPAAARDRVFDRFYRVQRGRSRRTGGAGLGLSIVRAVVEAHDGSVGVESRPGAGAAFRIELPRYDSAGAEPVAAAADGLDADQRVELSS
ncbi:MAG TPA: HAMP domain-containing sensor histidine kinase [Gaiellales bacterium]|nr:HAMP domain-containing sensor histidine kinase [Gaiellales bacterium]